MFIRNSTYRLKSFTLIEVLIGIALSAILISMCYLGLRILNQYFQQTKSRSDLFQERLAFNEVLQYQWNDAVKISELETGHLVFQYSDTLVNLQFEENLATYGNGVQYSLGKYECVAFYHQNPRNLKVVDSLRLRFWQEGDSTDFTYFKKYPQSISLEDYEHLD